MFEFVLLPGKIIPGVEGGGGTGVRPGVGGGGIIGGGGGNIPGAIGRIPPGSGKLSKNKKIKILYLV